MSQKYPRTPHLPWSPGASPDDERVLDVSAFVGREVVVTEKLDGECTTIHMKGCHARSLDTAPHPSREWVRALAGGIGYKIAELHPDLRIVGENVFAEHSIHYTDLPTYFLGFGAHVEDMVRSWRRTLALFEHLGVIAVPVLYQGLWDEDAVRACWTGRSLCGGEQEGYVVRLECGFKIKDFGCSVAKYVRAGHVQTDEHWLSKPVVKNGLAGGPFRDIPKIMKMGADETGGWRVAEMTKKPSEAEVLEQIEAILKHREILDGVNDGLMTEHEAACVLLGDIQTWIETFYRGTSPSGRRAK